MRKKLKKLCVIIGAVAVLLCVTFAIYFSIYYHADDEALSCLTANNSEDISIFYGLDDEIIFMPTDTEVSKGFIFYPGGKVEYSAYSPLLKMLAERGIMCILLKLPFNIALFDVNAADGIIERYPEIEEWYIGGHSLGGASASIYIYSHADSFNGLIMLGANLYADLSHTSLKVLSIHGEHDGILNKSKNDKNRLYAPDTYIDYIIEGGCHSYFGSYGEQRGDGKAEIAPDEQRRITVEQIILWMN